MSKVSWECKECGNVNAINKDKCICTNPRPTSHTPVGRSSHGGCTINNCPMPGGLSPSFSSKARWYCRWHYRIRNDAKLCAQVTADLISNPPVISGCTPSGKYVNCPPAAERYAAEKKNANTQK